MTISPKQVTIRTDLDNRVGIKSSLGKLSSVIGLLLALYRVSSKVAKLEYSEEYKVGNKTQIKLKPEYHNEIRHLYRVSDITLNTNPLLSSQLEALQVGVGLMFKLAQINFTNFPNTDTKERTGGERFKKTIRFSSNMALLDSIVSTWEEEIQRQEISQWINNRPSDTKFSNTLKRFLSNLSEDVLFKFRIEGTELYFQQEGIYRSLLEADSVVGKDSQEDVGPLRVFKSFVKEDLHPLLTLVDNEFEAKNKEELDRHTELVKTLLDLSPRRYSGTREKKNEDNKTEKRNPIQLIYFGTPGSGKSRKVKDIIEEKVSEGEKEHRVFRTTFHPDSDYASFVGCYKPMMEGEEIKYEFTPQVFTNAYVQAWKKQAEAIEQEKKQAEDVYLVIEEINRGNCAQIFGDLFQILDRDKDGVSEYGITPDVDLLAYLKRQLPKDSQGLAENKLRLPANLHILATMNTSDQSLFPMDSAFKRRWDWEYVPIDYSDNVDSSKFEISIGDEKDKKTYRWVDFLKAVNARILSATDSEDKQMGNFFIKHSVEEKEFKSKVMFYLWHEVCKDEYHTKNNFFRTGQDQAEEEFSFNQLHEDNGTSLLVGFMEYLGVTPLEDMTSQEGDGTPNDAEENNAEE